MRPCTLEATKDVTLVIFHTAVLPYVSSAAEREEFARSIGLLCDSWIADETPRVLSEIAGRAGREQPRGSYLLSVNGAPMAWADPHGALARLNRRWQRASGPLLAYIADVIQ
jgi:hypothetical protein